MNSVFGTTRRTFILSRIVIKVPRFCRWRTLLYGLLSNIEERRIWNDTHHPMLARVYWGCPLGLIVIMERAQCICDRDDDDLKVVSFFNRCENENLPVDRCSKNIGIFNEKWKMIDYGI